MWHVFIKIQDVFTSFVQVFLFAAYGCCMAAITPGAMDAPFRRDGRPIFFGPSFWALEQTGTSQLAIPGRHLAIPGAACRRARASWGGVRCRALPRQCASACAACPCSLPLEAPGRSSGPPGGSSGGALGSPRGPFVMRICVRACRAGLRTNTSYTQQLSSYN